jgi:hypothetical protein
VRLACKELPLVTLQASALNPVPLEIILGNWNAESGCFENCDLTQKYETVSDYAMMHVDA